MQHIAKALLAATFLFTFSSCQPVLKLLLGIKKPQLETPESLENHLSNTLFTKSICQENIWFLKNQTAYEKSIVFIDRLPSYLIVRPDGVVMDRGTSCFNPTQNEFDIIIDNAENQAIYSEFDFNTISDCYTNVKGESLKSVYQDSNNYRVIVIWAKYFSKKMNKKLADLLKSIEDSKHPIDVIFLNSDGMENWF